MRVCQGKLIFQAYRPDLLSSYFFMYFVSSSLISLDQHLQVHLRNRRFFPSAVQTNLLQPEVSCRRMHTMHNAANFSYSIKRLCNIQEITAARRDRSIYLRQVELRSIENTKYDGSQYFFNKAFQLCWCHFAASQVYFVSLDQPWCALCECNCFNTNIHSRTCLTTRLRCVRRNIEKANVSFSTPM